MKRLAILTISSHNYMSYGLDCLLSAKRFNEDADVYYLVADKFTEEYYKDYSDRITFLSLEQLGLSDTELKNIEFKYNIIEFNTCVKPLALQYLLNKGYNTAIYLDPDIECYSSFDGFLDEIKDKNIAVTPHKMSPVESEVIEDRLFLNNGIFNLGFIAVNNTKVTFDFLKWWDERLRDRCFIDYEHGLATDQIWVELASTIFEGFHITRNTGMNVAYWNIHERKLNKRNGKYYMDDYPLLFFHFSSLSIGCKKEFLDHMCKNADGFMDFYNEHIEEVKKCDFDKFHSIQYSFGNYSDNSVIDKNDRWLFGYSLELQKKFDNPFNMESDNCYKKYISTRKLASYMHPNSKNDKLKIMLIKFFGLRRALLKINRISVTRSVAGMIEEV